MGLIVLSIVVFCIVLVLIELVRRTNVLSMYTMQLEYKLEETHKLTEDVIRMSEDILKKQDGENKEQMLIEVLDLLQTFAEMNDRLTNVAEQMHGNDIAN